MSFIFAFLILSLVALAFYNIYAFTHSSGSVAQRLASAWKGSLTIFAAIWATIASYITTGLDNISAITGQPEFKTIADDITQILTPNVQHYMNALMPALVLSLVIWARMRTLGKPQ